MPLHTRLIKYRILHIAITIFFLYLGWDAFAWFKGHHKDLSEAGVVGFVSIYLTVLGALKYTLENSPHNNDNDP